MYYMLQTCAATFLLRPGVLSGTEYGKLHSVSQRLVYGAPRAACPATLRHSAATCLRSVNASTCDRFGVLEDTWRKGAIS